MYVQNTFNFMDVILFDLYSNTPNTQSSLVFRGIYKFRCVIERNCGGRQGTIFQCLYHLPLK